MLSAAVITISDKGSRGELTISNFLCHKYFSPKQSVTLPQS